MALPPQFTKKKKPYDPDNDGDDDSNDPRDLHDAPKGKGHLPPWLQKGAKKGSKGSKKESPKVAALRKRMGQ